VKKLEGGMCEEAIGGAGDDVCIALNRFICF